MTTVHPFDEIQDLSEAKRCLKITYQQSMDQFHIRLGWMALAIFELFVILGMLSRIIL